MTTATKQALVVTGALVAWGVLWFGGLIAGGLLFPAYEVPAMVGAAIGWVMGFAACCLVLWIGDVR